MEFALSVGWLVVAQCGQGVTAAASNLPERLRWGGRLCPFISSVTRPVAGGVHMLEGKLIFAVWKREWFEFQTKLGLQAGFWRLFF